MDLEDLGDLGILMQDHAANATDPFTKMASLSNPELVYDQMKTLAPKTLGPPVR